MTKDHDNDDVEQLVGSSRTRLAQEKLIGISNTDPALAARLASEMFLAMMEGIDKRFKAIMPGDEQQFHDLCSERKKLRSSGRRRR